MSAKEGRDAGSIGPPVAPSPTWDFRGASPRATRIACYVQKLVDGGSVEGPTDEVEEAKRRFAKLKEQR